MTDILLAAVALIVLVAGFLLLVRFARSDAFAGPGLGRRESEGVAPKTPRFLV